MRVPDSALAAAAAHIAAVADPWLVNHSWRTFLWGWLLAMKASMAAEMKKQSALRPDSRAAFLCALGFIGMIRRAPFEDGA